MMPEREIRGLLPSRGLLWALPLALLLAFFLLSTESFGEGSPDLVFGGVIRGEHVQGNAARLAHQALAPEGTARTSPEAVILDSAQSFIIVDLRGMRSVQALLLQADHDDSYVIEGSTDGVFWRTLWVVPSVYTGIGFSDMGLRTRTARLPYPVEVGFLRLRGGISGGRGVPVFSVSRFQAFSTVPAGWPPALDYSLPGSRPPLFPALDISTASLLMSFLAGLALILITWSAASAPHGGTPPRRRMRRASLGAMLVLSCLAWPNFLNFHFGGFYHLHEFYHYYIGAKYTEELRYHRLYECTAVAEMEDGRLREVGARTMRDLRSNTLVSTMGVIADPGRCRSQFSEERWREFTRDVRWFRERFPSEEVWIRSQTDFGFNATPAWMVLGTPLANLFPPSPWYLTVLSFLDILLLTAVVVAILRSFGLEATVSLVCFFSLSGLSSYLYTGGSFLRYDWFFWLAVGFSALRGGRERAAGFAFGSAALLRVFPGIVLGGLALKAALESLSERSFAPLKRYRDIALGMVLSVLMLLPLSLLVSGRAGVWGEFAENSRKHVQSESANYIGLLYFVEQSLDTPTGLLPEIARDRNPSAHEYRRDLGRTRTLASVFAILLLLTLFGFAVRRESLWVGAVLSLGLVPVLTVLSHYYYVMLAFFGLLWSVRPAVAVLLCLLAWTSWLPLGLFKDYATEFASLSGMILLFTGVVMMLVAFRERS